MANKINQDLALSSGDLYMVNGDLAIAQSDVQHIDDTINASPGWWKNNPPDGVGVFQYLNGTGQEQTIKRALIINLQSDGYVVTNPDVTVDNTGKLNIIPNASI